MTYTLIVGDRGSGKTTALKALYDPNDHGHFFCSGTSHHEHRFISGVTERGLRGRKLKLVLIDDVDVIGTIALDNFYREIQAHGADIVATTTSYPLGARVSPDVFVDLDDVRSFEDYSSSLAEFEDYRQELLSASA